MKTLLLITFTLLTEQFLYAQPLPQWSSSVATNFQSYFNDKPKLKLEPSGDLIVAGNTVAGVNGKDFLFIKYSPSGNIIWQRTFNGINNKDDELSDFVIDTIGNIIATGTSVVGSISQFAENRDILTVKYDSAGNFIWAKTYDGLANREDGAQSIALDSNGNSYVLGYTSVDTLDGDKIIIIKYNSIGDTVWTRMSSQTPTYIFQEKIKIINNELRVLAGYYTAAFPTVTNKYFIMKLDSNNNLLFSYIGVHPTSGSGSSFIDSFGNSYIGGGIAYKTTKINPNGTIAWTDSIPTNLPMNTSGDEVRTILVDSLQNVYTTGRHYGDDYGGSTYSNADILTIKYSPSGSKLWSKRYEYLSNNAADIANAITLDGNLNVYVAGESQRIVAGTDYDYVVVKYDLSGNEKGTIRYNDISDGNDAITSILVVDSLNIYLTGLTFENLLSNITTQKYSSLSGVGIIENNIGATTINAFPNPFTNTTTIIFSNTDNELFNFQLFSASGKNIENLKVRGDKIEISNSNIPAGLYTFKLFSDRRIYIGKLTKIK